MDLSCSQVVVNAAARLSTGTYKQEHITAILSSLHWLSVCFRMEYKLLLFVFKSLNWLAPPYLTDLLQGYTSTRSLRASDQLSSDLNCFQVQIKAWGDFRIAGHKLWNSLPLHVKAAST